MMNVIVKRVIEIAGGIVVGGLVSEGLDKVVKVTKKEIENRINEKGSQK